MIADKHKRQPAIRGAIEAAERLVFRMSQPVRL